MGPWLVPGITQHPLSAGVYAQILVKDTLLALVDTFASIYSHKYFLSQSVCRTRTRHEALGGQNLLKTLHLVTSRRPAERVMADPVKTLCI